ncbi:hypothetical protein [uncultured Mediterranean phage uvMED]|nr:hypothetical protein [uncultured Mediterranean phage uvMED]BAR14153.1 hypothetical protein [uncultured Mediterranean phage uvMED]BAR15997.1 hypothetical protein [uncultured Mediterranean phage uvMED]BAR37274.1 hypothetical protein [uncultured Mediterranean phage uvMED]
MITIAEAIKSINPNAEFVYTEEDINTIEWHNGTTPISVSDIQAKQTELQTAYDNAEYQRNRAKEYPSWQEQLDMQYWDKVNGTSTWQDAIAKVKSDNPKE